MPPLPKLPTSKPPTHIRTFLHSHILNSFPTLATLPRTLVGALREQSLPQSKIKNFTSKITPSPLPIFFPNQKSKISHPKSIPHPPPPSASSQKNPFAPTPLFAKLIPYVSPHSRPLHLLARRPHHRRRHPPKPSPRPRLLHCRNQPQYPL